MIPNKCGNCDNDSIAFIVQSDPLRDISLDHLANSCKDCLTTQYAKYGSNSGMIYREKDADDIWAFIKTLDSKRVPYVEDMKDESGKEFTIIMTSDSTFKIEKK